MNEPEHIKGALPSKFKSRPAELYEVKSLETMIERYHLMLGQFAEFEIMDFILEYKFDFEQAFQDFIACSKCQGECGASLYVLGGVPMYYGLSWDGMLSMGKDVRPVFTAHICPGVAQQKTEIYPEGSGMNQGGGSHVKYAIWGNQHQDRTW